MKLLTTTFAMILALGVSVPTISEAARCDKACKERKKQNLKIWKSAKKVVVNGETFYVAVLPDRTAAFASFDKSAKAFKIEDMVKASSTVSGCKAYDNQGYDRLQKAKGGSIPTKIFKSMKYMRIELKC
jgi:hypothetical protein